MTKNQYYKIALSFASYADSEVEFMTYRPSLDKHVTSQGWLKGIGLGANADCIIIAQCGRSMAIHYTKVKFPKTC